MAASLIISRSLKSFFKLTPLSGCSCSSVMVCCFSLFHIMDSSSLKLNIFWFWKVKQDVSRCRLVLWKNIWQTKCLINEPEIIGSLSANEDNGCSPTHNFDCAVFYFCVYVLSTLLYNCWYAITFKTVCFQWRLNSSSFQDFTFWIISVRLRDSRNRQYCG